MGEEGKEEGSSRRGGRERLAIGRASRLERRLLLDMHLWLRLPMLMIPLLLLWW